MEEYGRLTFPNSRTASPVIDQDLVITRGITANWGKDGPGADRFYAFDKKTGELVWSSSPGDRPKDNSFSHPVLRLARTASAFFIPPPATARSSASMPAPANPSGACR